ncbi:MAG: hypothetical protein BroJett018_51100 [Chloroflexota bacterium]|nr:MAG: hypothetical protein BroJett018_51100 [Chloroflexota bacterium]
MESMGCLRWLLMLVPMSLLTALGLGVMENPIPLPPAPVPTSPYDYASYYTTQDGSLQFPYLPGWGITEVTPGVVSLTNSPDWYRAVNNQQLYSGEFVISVTTPQALRTFGADPTSGTSSVIEFFQLMASPEAVYSLPISQTIGGREALRVDINNPTIPIEIQFYAYAVQWDRVAVVTLQTLPGEAYLGQDLVIGLMERMYYLGEGYSFATPTMYDGGTLPFPTPYATPTYPPDVIYATLANATPIPTAVGAFTVEIEDVTAAGNIRNEAVILRFNGRALMGDWSLRLADGRFYYVFPPMLVYEGTTLTIHSGFGQDGPTDLYAGYGDAQLRSGDSLFLYDSASRLMNSFVVP